MIEPVKNTKFVNRKHIGNFVKIEFDTYLEQAGGKQDIHSVEADMHYYEKGTGEPLILIHDLGQSLYTYRNVIDELAEHHRVIAVDMLGHGYSGSPDIYFTVEENALCLEAFMNALRIVKADIVACGQSCIYALNFALYNKERVGKIILISPGCFAGTRTPVMGFSAPKLIKKPYLAKYLDKCYFDKTLLKSEVIDEVFLPLENPETKNTLKRFVVNYDDTEVFEKSREIDSKVLIITSDDDAFSNQDDIAHMASGFKEAYRYVLRNCGHYPQEEKPDKVYESIEQFLMQTGEAPAEKTEEQ